jgi:Zn-dependent protease
MDSTRQDSCGESNEAATAIPANESNLAFTAVYDEIERMANSKANWINGILTLFVTAAIFSTLALGHGDWRPIAMVVGVLLFHELGHLAAMRLFGYRNLRVFFVPFFGAAVTGKNYNVPGWKKAVVSLMGPLPGIIVGAILGVAAVIYQSPVLVGAASLLLAVKAFNLLPIMPLDGGRLMEAVLFSRHPVLDTAFRVVTAGLLIFSWFIGMKVLAVLGVIMLFAVPTTFRVGQVVRRLRKRGFDASSVDAQTIPVETARSIHDEIRLAFPTHLKTKASAQLTLQAFESLNARSPNGLVSLALIGIQGLTLLVAVAVAIAIYPQQMIMHSTKAIELNPRDAQAFHIRGRAHKWLGHYQQAVSDCTKAIDLGANDANVFYDRGYSNEGLGQYELAISDFTKAIITDPKLATAYCERGFCYAVSGKKDKARADLRRALQLSPVSPALRHRIQKISGQYGLGI